MVDSKAASELESSVRQLAIAEKAPVPDIPRLTATTTTSSAKSKKKAAPVADSWEDEVDDEEDDLSPDPDAIAELQSVVTDSSRGVDVSTKSKTKPASLVAEGPLDPPPTPVSLQTSQPWVGSAYEGRPQSPQAGAGEGTAAGRRPEKQTAVASRLIAGALGIRAPKRTEEQRAYDRAVKEQEIRRRNREREEQAKAKEADERAKAAVWED
ncbi:hypothetical protein ASPZODRAFT_128231 [Penicilliopsis zonata CBS 506.65]|uniref:Uncharacterized protein n=1 Tax=Penicilliopsis zonata CBS 506.65 TaxID=1073090 RepID=A0A1L9SRD4_9EURO|nr:hypothetical protein ASPZODRAFT_128231 [Penicilliopsis zonata CBS 506.65]OJJ49718.1 hypothetical protein ASPZODRAFT_128231 [Penicilliopsis zonata CBS 506.65]